MTLAQRLVLATCRGLTKVLCRVDDAQLARLPDKGPLIVVGNHVNVLEIPILYSCVQPRPATAFAAAHRWESLWSRWLLNVMGAIPIRRGQADLTALRRAVEMLEAGYIVAIAPEGTRSGDGRLQKGHPGSVFLALHSGVPVLPVVFYGAEHYADDWRHLRRTEFHIVVGRPFHLDPGESRVTRAVRQRMLDEVMYQMAALLPPSYRGAYSDLDRATETYLAFQ